jgi:hypothetical protein
MKAILEFNLPEEQEAHYEAVNGSAFRYCLQELDGELRSWLKYGHSFTGAEDALKRVRDELHQLIHDNDVILQ